jgi:hypothetical protein
MERRTVTRFQPGFNEVVFFSVGAASCRDDRDCHSLKEKNFTLLGAIFLTHSKILSKEPSHFANVPDQSPASATQYFCKNLYRK